MKKIRVDYIMASCYEKGSETILYESAAEVCNAIDSGAIPGDTRMYDFNKPDGWNAEGESFGASFHGVVLSQNKKALVKVLDKCDRFDVISGNIRPSAIKPIHLSQEEPMLKINVRKKK